MDAITYPWPSQLTPVSKSAMNSGITIYIDTTFFPYVTSSISNM